MGKPEVLSGSQTENSNLKSNGKAASGHRVTPDTGLSVPFPTGGVENRADDSKRWDKSSFDTLLPNTLAKCAVLCRSAS